MEKKTVSRGELYAQVWGKPMSKLSKEYGVSDVGLAKICKRMEIPRPPRGYWAMLDAGRAPPKPKLKKLSKGGISEVIISPTLESYEAENDLPLFPLKEVSVPEQLDQPHKLTQKTLTALRKGKSGDRGIIIPINKICLDVKVTKTSIDRACLVMDTLLKAMEEEGFTVSVVGERPVKTIVVVDGETIEFGVDEKISQADHLLTEEEKRKRKCGEWVYPPKYDYHSTGKLKLMIRNGAWLGVRQQWTDASIQRIEDCLGSFIQGLQRTAVAFKIKREQDAIRETEWAERERQLIEERRLQANEKAKGKKLASDIERWEKAQRIRKYLVTLNSQTDKVPGLDEWIKWSRSQADKIDPLMNPEQLIYSEENANIYSNSGL